ncbi:MAG TPA: ribonuclease E inhibitor RraB, partial [Cytophaga sp.]|nr:ribonuclease E inhibitor RraB [Cytophaga sp.]
KAQRGFKGEFFIRIRIPEHKLFGGIPNPDELSYQNQKESELCESLIKDKIKCMQVARLTFDGQKQYIFEHNNSVGFKRTVTEWIQSFSSEYVIELNPLAPFEYYKELLPDNFIWQQIGSRKLITLLINAGSNEHAVHFIEHTILGDTKDLKNLYEELKNNEISLIRIEDDLLEVGIHSSIELDDITVQTDYLISASEKYHCQYDGWSTHILRLINLFYFNIQLVPIKNL